MRVPRRVAISLGAVALALLLLLLWHLVRVLAPAPPRSVVMFTGPEGGSYFELGKRYRDILARDGVELRLVPTAGAVDNLRRLEDPASGPSVGFVQGGTASVGDRAKSTLVSLGTLNFEPLWFFHVRSLKAFTTEDLRGKRIDIGAEGSGTRALALRLLAANRIEAGFARFVALKPSEAAEQLLSGELSAAYLSEPWDSPVVQRLLTSGQVEPFNYPRADAYVALFPFLTKLTLPAGVADLARNIPPQDTTLFAPKTSLVVQRSLHPGVQYLLLQAASEIHARQDVFQAAARFPAPEADDFPLSEHARQYYKSGPPWLQRYLPLWLAVLANQALLVLVPLVGVVYPLMRGLPSLYFWNIRRRIFRTYAELRFIEREIAVLAGERQQQLREHLQALESRVDRMRVPSFMGHMVYSLKVHIGLVRAELDRRVATAAR
jgi:TRAP-type uncharacterized transport system substrate-binding protein